MDETITDKKPQLQNRSNGLASFDEWMAHKQLCRKIFEEAQVSLRISREDYFTQLETLVSIHKGIDKGSNKS